MSVHLLLLLSSFYNLVTKFKWSSSCDPLIPLPLLLQCNETNQVSSFPKEIMPSIMTALSLLIECKWFHFSLISSLLCSVTWLTSSYISSTNFTLNYERHFVCVYLLISFLNLLIEIFFSILDTRRHSIFPSNY